MSEPDKTTEGKQTSERTPEGETPAAEASLGAQPAGECVEAEKEENLVDTFAAESEGICRSLEKSFRRAFGDMPNRADLAELHALQAAIGDLVRRAAESGAGAQSELKKLAKERDFHKDAATRAKADFLNYQERARRDLTNAEESVLRGYVSDLLPVLDSMDLALADAKSKDADPERIRAAVEMIAEALEQVLKVRGLERIEAAGKPFDPNFHEAVSTRPADPGKSELPNQVVEELRPGFSWKGKVLRPCQVLTTESKPADKVESEN
jgi:molecular chaperone GrpE